MRARQTLKKQSARWLTATLLLSALILVPTASVAAIKYYTFYSSSSASEGTWHSKTVTGGARYNRATASTYNSVAAHAYLSVGGVGTSESSYKVTMTFAYQGGTFKCKWEWYGHTGKGPLYCKLGYGS